MYGLWSLERQDWMFDPMSDADKPPPMRFEDVMDAITAAAGYHFAFRIIPVGIEADGRPNPDDLASYTEGE